MKQWIKQAAKAVGLWLLQGIIGAVIVLGGAVVLVEWLAGCGEHYIDSQGRTHIHQCIVLSELNRE